MKKILQGFVLCSCLLLWGCEKKVDPATEKNGAESSSALEDSKAVNDSDEATKFIIEEVSPIGTTVKLGEKDYDPEKIIKTYFAGGKNDSITTNKENEALVRKISLQNKAFQTHWKYWLYGVDKEANPGILVLSAKSNELEEAILVRGLEILKNTNDKWDKILGLVKKICNRQDASESCN